MPNRKPHPSDVSDEEWPRWDFTALRRPGHDPEPPAIRPKANFLSQRLPERTVGASYGDGMLAGIACGLLDRDASWTSMADTVVPDPENRGIYDEIYTIYRDLYPATRQQAHALANIQMRGDTAPEEAAT